MTRHEKNNHVKRDVITLCRLARRLQKQGNYKEAEEKFILALESDPDNPYALVGLGDLKRKRKRFKEALNYYQKCLEVEIDNRFALAGLGDAYRALEEVDKALEVWLHYLSLTPGDYKVMTRVADGFRKEGDCEIAMKIAKEYCFMALKQNPDDPYALSCLGDIYLREANDEEALKFFEKLIRTSSDPIRALTSAGYIYLKRKQHYKAMDCFDRALEMDPQSSYAWHGKAHCLTGIEDYPSAIKAWRMALDYGMEPRIALTRIGDAYLELKDVKYAKLNYQKALTLGYDKYAYLGMARIHTEKNNIDKALKILSMLAEKEPDDPRIADELSGFVEKHPRSVYELYPERRYGNMTGEESIVHHVSAK